MNAPLLEVEDLTVVYGGAIRAVDKVSLTLDRGKTLGLVGESGCGKSTTGHAILRLTRPTSGRVRLNGVDLSSLSTRELRRTRRHMQIIFQDAAASLDPRTSIGDLIGEALDIHGIARGAERLPRIRRLLDTVGMPSRFIERYPHELSGGQAQRIAICRALAVEPQLIVCDEPVSALDVSIQAQIVNLLQELQAQFGLSYLFISHDLSVVRHISDEVAVMYLGRVVERASKEAIFDRPGHPYTKALLSAVPIPDPAIESRRQRIVLQGDLPSPANPPTGCRFRTRCPSAVARCAALDPAMVPLEQGHAAACILLERAA